MTYLRILLPQNLIRSKFTDPRAQNGSPFYPPLLPMKNFDISHHTYPLYDILELKGELDAHTSPRLEEALQRLLREQRNRIIVNCRDLQYIASAGLGVFMAYIEEVREKGGDIKLTNMNDQVYNVFDLLGFPSLYDIFKDVSEAVNDFTLKA